MFQCFDIKVKHQSFEYIFQTFFLKGIRLHIITYLRDKGTYYINHYGIEF